MANLKVQKHLIDKVFNCKTNSYFIRSSNNSQENTCAWVSFLLKLQASCLRPDVKSTSSLIFHTPYLILFYFLIKVYFCFLPIIHQQERYPYTKNSKKISVISKFVTTGLSSSRSSRSDVFCKKGVIKNVAKFTAKNLCQRPATLLKKRLWHRCFPVNFTKFLRTPIL